MTNHGDRKEEYILNERIGRETAGEGEKTQFISQESDANDNGM